MKGNDKTVKDYKKTSLPSIDKEELKGHVNYKDLHKCICLANEV